MNIQCILLLELINYISPIHLRIHPGSAIFIANEIIDFMSNTVNIGLFLDSRRELVKKGAGVFGIKVDLRYMGRRWQFATPFTMTQSEWENLENRKIRSDALKEKKLQLEEYKVKA